MKTINLRWIYPHYRHDEFVEVSDEVWEAMRQAKREMCKNRHPSPICTRFEHHLAGVLAPLSRTEAPKPYNWFSTAKL